MSRYASSATAATATIVIIFLCVMEFAFAVPQAEQPASSRVGGIRALAENALRQHAHDRCARRVHILSLINHPVETCARALHSHAQRAIHAADVLVSLRSLVLRRKIIPARRRRQLLLALKCAVGLDPLHSIPVAVPP